jgi:hypothetical protein
VSPRNITKEAALTRVGLLRQSKQKEKKKNKKEKQIAAFVLSSFSLMFFKL